jgi:hypothetical protein
MTTHATLPVTMGLIVLCSVACAQEIDFRGWEDCPGLHVYLVQPAELWNAGVLSVECVPVRDHVSGESALRLVFPASRSAAGVALYRPPAFAAASRQGFRGLSFWVKGDGSAGVGVVGIGDGRGTDPHASFLLKSKTWQPVRFRWTDFDAPVTTPELPSIFFGVTSDTRRPASYLVDRMELVRSVEASDEDAAIREAGAKAARLTDVPRPQDLSAFVTNREKLARSSALVAAKKPLRVLVVGDAVAQGAGLWNVPVGVRSRHLFWGALEQELKRRGADATVTPVFVEKAEEAAARIDVMLARTKAELVIVQLSASGIGTDSTELRTRVHEADRAIFDACRRAGAEVIALVIPPLPEQLRRANEAAMLLEEAVRAHVAAADFGKLSEARGKGFQGEYYATPDQLNGPGHLLAAKLLASALANP